ncbi:type II secretion system protein GspK [Pseudomonas sp. RC10]|uniref:type II secretion system protein GspK n=1 Tax=Pseudomonas bambusae TaxID=3139142 RepID=UPI00313A0752
MISVLLITSLALMVIGGVLRSHRLTLQTTVQQVQHLHLRQAALAAESRAMQLLQDSVSGAGETTHLAQAWAMSPQGFRLPDLDVRLSIEDLGGRFNLTHLAVPESVDDVYALRWFRLLNALDIEPFDLSALKTQPFSNAAQLQQIPGLRPSDLQHLLPWIAVLPRDAALNVNTAPAQVLASLEGMTTASALELIRQRPSEGYPDAAAFVGSATVDGLGISPHGLGVRSRWFRITAEVGLADSRMTMVSDLERVANTQRLRIIQRRLLSPAQGSIP